MAVKNSQSLLSWILLVLLLVGLMPFAITAYQINQSQKSLIEQVRQTHLVSVTTIANKVEAFISRQKNIILSLGTNTSFSENLESLLAQEILANTLIQEKAILAIGVFDSDDNKLLKMAQKKSASNNARQYFDQFEYSADPLIFTHQENKYILIQHKSLTDKLLIKSLLEYQSLIDLLKIQELETLRLSLIDRSGEVIDGRIQDYSTLPENFKRMITADQIISGADNYLNPEGDRQVSAFAKVSNSKFVVLSNQLANDAEQANKSMRETALTAFIGALLLCLLIAWAAYKRVIKPIRTLISNQNKLLGIDNQAAKGSEIDQLKESFVLLEKYIKDKDKDKIRHVSLGRYQVISTIGSGAMGSVFKGWDPRLERFIALKTIKVGELEGQFDRTHLVKQLVNESRLIARVQHPNVISIFDAEAQDDIAYVAMELIEGLSLSDYLKIKRRLSPKQTFTLLHKLLLGLSAAHQNNIVHRDIKTGNVLLGYNGAIKLTDFGIAGVMNERIEANQVLGSPGYIAPEILRGGEYTAASDIFALGVMTYKCLMGKNPFAGSDVSEILKNTIKRNPVNPLELYPNFNSALANIILLMLQKDPAKRPNDAQVIAENISKLIKLEPWQPPLLEATPIHSDESTSNVDSYAKTIMMHNPFA